MPALKTKNCPFPVHNKSYNNPLEGKGLYEITLYNDTFYVHQALLNTLDTLTERLINGLKNTIRPTQTP